MSMEQDLPFRAEYAKSGRSSCRTCKSPINNGVLRIAVLVQSSKFDSKMPMWHHRNCFFKKARVKSADDIANFETLRYEDQQSIKKKIETNAAPAVIVPATTGKKRNAAVAKQNAIALKDYKVEYSKSSRAECSGCRLKIMKNEVRISKKDYTTETGIRFGGQDIWRHLSCFAQLRNEVGFYESGEVLPGFKQLKKEDQEEVKTQLPPIKQEGPPPTKIAKTESSEDRKVEKEIAAQTKVMYKWRDQLVPLHKNELIDLLKYNKQTVPAGKERILDDLADIMTFGALKPCKKCKGGQLVFQKNGYACLGDISEWCKCDHFTTTPPRTQFKVPKDLKEKYSFLGEYKATVGERAVRDVKPTVEISSIVKKEEKEEEEDEMEGPKVKREAPPLYDMQFVLCGKLSKSRAELKDAITKYGGKVATKISKQVMAVIGTKAEVKDMRGKMEEAKEEDVQVVSEDFLDEVTEYRGKIPELIKKKSICSWGSDPKARLPAPPTTSRSAKSKSIYTKSVPGKKTLTIKGGMAVDPDSDLQHRAHVYVDGDDKYTVVLGLTDIVLKKNSYYKIQLLESDSLKCHWVFRSWGRIGTTIGDTKLELLATLKEAKKRFQEIYLHKTGNEWQDRDHFEKQPGLMYPIDVDYDEPDNPLAVTSAIPSKLDQPVQDLLSLIFDVAKMKQVMVEFELDTERMPLGKLSKKQLQSGYRVLSELQELVEKKEAINKLVEATNRFYTLIPHSFGVSNPPVIDSLETIGKKVEMIESLLEMEVAQSLMAGSTTSETAQHHLDAYYASLDARIEVLARTSPEFALIEEYVRNTHAATHAHYTLAIAEVFVVRRAGEDRRFKPFAKLANHQLLWHGSRTTNFAGILAQGLRIAPKEAPSTGYMFGKGIYFADMVSKSANYCCVDPSNSTGLMLLCQVALGNMHELAHADYVEKLPAGKHSVKGVGKTEPNPQEAKETEKGVRVPLGKPVVAPLKDTSLLYNEYIVYDVAQVQIQYLLRLNFNYKY